MTNEELEKEISAKIAELNRLFNDACIQGLEFRHAQDAKHMGDSNMRCVIAIKTYPDPLASPRFKQPYIDFVNGF